jgi:catechol 2,3-dioxygenase-like lactoylglutathione lyase family enzyme
MPLAFHHVSIRVADLERAADFYTEALGAVRRTRFLIHEGAWGEALTGIPGVRYKQCHLSLGEDGIELMEFEEPKGRAWDLAPTHFSVQVDDVAATLERWEAAGGKRNTDVVTFGEDARVAFATDPDGNIIELLDKTFKTLMETVLRDRLLGSDSALTSVPQYKVGD